MNVYFIFHLDDSSSYSHTFIFIVRDIPYDIIYIIHDMCIYIICVYMIAYIHIVAQPTKIGVLFCHKVATNLLLLVKSFEKSKLAFEILKISDFAIFYYQKLLKKHNSDMERIGARMFPNEFWHYGYKKRKTKVNSNAFEMYLFPKNPKKVRKSPMFSNLNIH